MRELHCVCWPQAEAMAERSSIRLPKEFIAVAAAEGLRRKVLESYLQLQVMLLGQCRQQGKRFTLCQTATPSVLTVGHTCFAPCVCLIL